MATETNHQDIIPKAKKPRSTTSTKKTNDQCKEYNTLKYKTMIMTGNNLDVKIENETNEDILNSFLEADIKRNKNDVWSKLTKTEKIKKLTAFLNTNLKELYDLTPEEITHTKKFMLMLLERKKLSKNSDVDYDKESGCIQSLDVISFNLDTRKFALNKDYKPSSIKNTSAKRQSSKTKKSKETNDE
jgi:hypothetical protein